MKFNHKTPNYDDDVTFYDPLFGDGKNDTCAYKIMVRVRFGNEK